MINLIFKCESVTLKTVSKEYITNYITFNVHENQTPNSLKTLQLLHDYIHNIIYTNGATMDSCITFNSDGKIKSICLKYSPKESRNLQDITYIKNSYVKLYIKMHTYNVENKKTIYVRGTLLNLISNDILTPQSRILSPVNINPLLKSNFIPQHSSKTHTIVQRVLDVLNNKNNEQK